MSGAEMREFSPSDLNGAVPAVAMALPGAPNHSVGFAPAGSQQLNLSDPQAIYQPDPLQLRTAQYVRESNLRHVPQSRMSRDYRALNATHQRVAATRNAPRAPSAPATREEYVARMEKAQISPRLISQYRKELTPQPGLSASRQPAAKAVPEVALPQNKIIPLGNDSPLVRGARATLRMASVGLSPAGLPATVASVAEEALTFIATMPPKVAQALKPAAAFNQYAAMRPMQPANGRRRSLLAPAA